MTLDCQPTTPAPTTASLPSCDTVEMVKPEDETKSCSTADTAEEEEESSRYGDESASLEDNKAAGEEEESGRSVRFGTVQIYSHATILGDNPSTRAGPPVALGNEKLFEDLLEVDEYEASRLPRRTKKEMALTRFDRETRLRDEGYTRADFRDVAVEMRKLKRLRIKNSRPSLVEKVQLWKEARANKAATATSTDSSC